MQRFTEAIQARAADIAMTGNGQAYPDFYDLAEETMHLLASIPTNKVPAGVWNQDVEYLSRILQAAHHSGMPTAT